MPGSWLLQGLSSIFYASCSGVSRMRGSFPGPLCVAWTAGDVAAAPLPLDPCVLTCHPRPSARSASTGLQLLTARRSTDRRFTNASDKPDCIYGPGCGIAKHRRRADLIPRG